jgi:RimJ/RimL family protein N-acetyltransferase
MIHLDILAALPRGRPGAFLAKAEAARRARQTRRHRQPGPASGTRTTPRLAAAGTPVVLRDASVVLIRQVRSTDAPLLAEGFARLSPRSRRMRFLGAKTTLSEADLRYFTEVDHHDHEAIGALSAADGRGVGIARYIRDDDDPQAAEVAVTVVDDWQGRGLGTELLSRLSDRARQADIHRLTALAAAENVAVAGLARKLGACLAGRGPGTTEYEVPLVPADYGLDWWFGCVDGPASDPAWREAQPGKAFPAGADVPGASRAWRTR